MSFKMNLLLFSVSCYFSLLSYSCYFSCCNFSFLFIRYFHCDSCLHYYLSPFIDFSSHVPYSGYFLSSFCQYTKYVVNYVYKTISPFHSLKAGLGGRFLYNVLLTYWFSIR
uniref:SJCHGC07064 protein n=1 Tax=Schistosoma japonicum TaxID=6182 RepID=Q5DC70_SCHJA|nr:SJCHGC07064 protein [Schistosoma japonicum]